MTNDQPENQDMTAMLGATEDLWRSVHAEFGLLTAQELSLRLGCLPEDVRALYGAGDLIAVHRGGRVLYPGFQATGTGEVIPVIRDLLCVAEDAGRSQAALILWLVSAEAELGGARPVDLLHDGERVLAAAGRMRDAPK